VLHVEQRLTRLLPSADFRERMRAWWDGRHPDLDATLPGTAPSGDEPSADLAPDGEHPGPRIFWTKARIDLAQRIWGPEHVTPGGDEHVATLLKPLSLNPSMNIFELGAGLGAAARMMHKRFGAWPKSFEADPALAEVAAFLSKAAGLLKKAPVAHMPLDDVSIKANGFDRIILRDVAHLAPDKSALLRAVTAGLRKRGLILITDFVLARPDETDAAVEAWRTGEPSVSSPWSEAELRAALRAVGLDVRTAEDESAILRTHILDGWKAYQPTLLASSPSPELVMQALEEGERWRRCVAALDGGALRHTRIIASKP